MQTNKFFLFSVIVLYYLTQYSSFFFLRYIELSIYKVFAYTSFFTVVFISDADLAR